MDRKTEASASDVLRQRCQWNRFRPSNYLQLFQTADYVVIVQEFAHDARIVPLDGRPPLAQHVRQWRGTSRGHWDERTLVVETRGFRDEKTFHGSGPNMRLVERFTRTDARTLRYEFTVDDPDSFARPWSVVLPMRRSDGVLYEVACHEGNHSMPLILSGGRALDIPN